MVRHFWSLMRVGWWAQLTPREYLETALRPVAGSGRAVEAKNAVRGGGVVFDVRASLGNWPHMQCSASAPVGVSVWPGSPLACHAWVMD